MKTGNFIGICAFITVLIIYLNIILVSCSVREVRERVEVLENCTCQCEVAE